MEDRAARIAGLELILVVEGVKQVVSGASGKLARIGIIWLRAARGHDVRPLLPIMPREAVGGRFSGVASRLKKLARNLLVVLEAEAACVQGPRGRRPSLLRLYTLAEEVEAAFVHAHEAYRVEVVVEAAEVAARVGKEAAVKEARDDLALDAERFRGQVHEPVQARVELRPVARDMAYAGQVDGDDAYRGP